MRILRLGDNFAGGLEGRHDGDLRESHGNKNQYHSKLPSTGIPLSEEIGTEISRRTEGRGTHRWRHLCESVSDGKRLMRGGEGGGIELRNKKRLSSGSRSIGVIAVLTGDGVNWGGFNKITTSRYRRRPTILLGDSRSCRQIEITNRTDPVM